MGDDRPRWISLIGRAQTGDAEEVLVDVGAPRGAADDGWAGAASVERQFVRVIALHCLADYDAAGQAAQALLRRAEELGDEAWISIGRSYRVLEGALRPEAAADSLESDTLLRELAEAEGAIPTVGDPWVRSLAHIGVGRCYLHLRLYELALPHFGVVVELAESDLPTLAPTLAAAHMNLCDLDLRWGLELQRVGEAEAAEAHFATAHRHAVLVERSDSGRQGNAFLTTARLFAACLASATGDPIAGVGTIEDALAGLGAQGRPSNRALALLFIARALYRSGDVDAALAAAHLACSALPPGAAEPLEAAVHYARADLLSRGDPAERAPILEYGDRLARIMWRQRQRTVSLARWMQGMYRMRQEADGIRTMAFTDALTGVGNRHALTSHLVSLAAARVEDVAVLIVDVDDLKLVNDARGHRAGDAVLQTIAGVLSSHARSDDLVVRMGGDEFAVVAAHVTTDAATMLAQRVVEAAAGALGGMASVSVGVATGAAATVEGILLRTADEAMYAAKRSGGGAVRVSDPYVGVTPPG